MFVCIIFRIFWGISRFLLDTCCMQHYTIQGNERESPNSLLPMNRLKKFKTLGNLSIILEEYVEEYTSQQSNIQYIKKERNADRSQQCNRLDLETLGIIWLIVPKNLPGPWLLINEGNMNVDVSACLLRLLHLLLLANLDDWCHRSSMRLSRLLCFYRASYSIVNFVHHLLDYHNVLIYWKECPQKECPSCVQVKVEAFRFCEWHLFWYF